MVQELRVTETKLKGLYVIDLIVHADARGSFREAFQAVKLEELGLPKLGPVQWNISDNTRPGIVRGIHAEPWDKFIHCISGQAFAAIVDLRPESETFGQHLTFNLDQSNALFVSKYFFDLACHFTSFVDQAERRVNDRMPNGGILCRGA